MFKKRSLAVVVILILCFGFTLLQMFHVSSRNRRKYAKMLLSMQPVSVDKYGSTRRNKVKKDLWVEKEEGLFHYLLVSGDSILHLNQNQQAKTHAVEEMDDITCYLQQKKYYLDPQGQEVDGKGEARQQVCILKIASGKYHYLHNHFLGDNVLISIYDLPGHELSTSIETGKQLLGGTCDNIKFSLDEQNPNLRTHNLKAQIYTQQEKR